METPKFIKKEENLLDFFRPEENLLDDLEKLGIN